MFGLQKQVPAGNQQLGEDTREADLISLTMAALRFKSATGNNATDVITPNEEVCQDTSVIVITLEEVSWHDSPQDCWIILYDNVYDITNFLDQHPGGSDILLENAGLDATLAFRGAGHSKSAISALKRYQIGVLPIHERMFRKTGGIKIRDLPE